MTAEIIVTTTAATEAAAGTLMGTLATPETGNDDAFKRGIIPFVLSFRPGGFRT